MRLMVFALGACISVFSVTATPVSAQNWRLNPSYGTVSLNWNFRPDPQTQTVQAGGDNHFSGSSGCPYGGWFASAPDYRLHYNAGQYSLTFYVRARGDTMLLVNDPTATWYCNDDGDGLDPVIRLNNPRSGQYDIWVGTYGRTRVRNAVLHISEY